MYLLKTTSERNFNTGLVAGSFILCKVEGKYPDYIILGEKTVYLDEDYNCDLMSTTNLVYSKKYFLSI